MVQCLASKRLCAHKPETPSTIAARDDAHRTGTQNAHAIVDDDRMFVRKRRNVRIATI